ncbi:IS110 family transposase [Nocardia gipuzkoensis]
MPFVGWDWASKTHDVTVIDDRGRVLDRWAFSHTEQAWTTTLARLARHGDPADLPVIIERTSGLIVDRLLTAGYPVVPVHPTAFHAARPRWGASGAKSDPGNGYKLADYLRTDGHRLRQLDPVDVGLRELQALIRIRDDRVQARTAAINQLASLLDNYGPGPKNLFCSLASPIALAFLTAYPTPQSAARLSEVRMAAFLRRNSYRGGKPAALLLARLHAAAVPAAQLPNDTLALMIGTQVQLLRGIQTAIADLENLIRQRVDEHPRAQLLAALPGVGTINLAQLLAEIGPILDRVDTVDQAGAECGVTPVTKASPPRPAASTSAGQPEVHPEWWTGVQAALAASVRDCS